MKNSLRQFERFKIDGDKIMGGRCELTKPLYFSIYCDGDMACQDYNCDGVISTNCTSSWWCRNVF